MATALASAGAAITASVLTALIAWWRGRGRDRAEIARLRAERDQLRAAADQGRADAAAAITTAATTLLQPLRDRVEHLEQIVQQQRDELRELRPLRDEVEQLRRANSSLRAQLLGLRNDLDQRTGANDRSGG